MNRALVDRIADAVLYEGYILYPYRPSVKNQQRWTFGGLYPEAYSQGSAGADPWMNQTECLVRGGPGTTLDVTIRFLHLTARRVGELVPPRRTWPNDVEPPFRFVETLCVGDRLFHTWQEAEERTIALHPLEVGEVEAQPHTQTFGIPGRRWLEPVHGEAGAIVGVLVRDQQALSGSVELGVVPVAEGLYKLTLRVRNQTPLADIGPTSRDEALMRSLVSTHAILRVHRGAFVSLLEPPEEWRDLAAACQNVGTWPVLVGEPGQSDTVLSAPIILYDYPQVAPESAGDLFDSTEIDEILTLRILTLTEEEKRQMASVDERARAVLARTESLAGEQLLRLHGAVRCLRPVREGEAHG